MFSTDELLLALTHNFVIITLFRLESDVFRNVANLVKVYVMNECGIVFLFETDEEVGRRVATHELSHNRGLVHYEKPLNLIYVGSLGGFPVLTNEFCVGYRDKLEN
jgi:hypothetical protein